MRKTLVLLDCDGPLADFVTGFLGAVEEETGERYGGAVVTEWEITDSPFFKSLAREQGRDVKELASAVWRRVNRIGFCSALEPVEGAQEAIEHLRLFPNVEVEVITSPLLSSPTWMTERHEWLRRHFGFKKDQVHLVASKHRVPGDFLVDDKPSHVYEWGGASQKAGWHGLGLLWHAPYNDLLTGGQRVHSWDQVSGIIQAREELLSKEVANL